MNYKELVAYLDAYLNIAEITDYGPQGLQVEAEKENVQRVALAVDVAPPIIDAAAAWGADMLVVHHGVLWRAVERIAGPLGQRIRPLLKNGIHLYAAHLPLDAHPEVGNNAVLAQMLGVAIEDWWCAPKGTPLAIIGHRSQPASLADFVQEVEAKLGTTARVLAHGPGKVQQIAILSGFGADQVGTAAGLRADTFLTGETSHANFWAAVDHGINVIYAGHYATETVGVKVLGDHLAGKYNLEVKFFHFPTSM